MPEGPELHLAANTLNKICEGIFFKGAVVKSEISKCPKIQWNAESYTICALSRGKEVKLVLSEAKSGKRQGDELPKSTSIIFRYGLTGKFSYDPADEMQKHAHLNFFTDGQNMVLSFVDTMRFGSWEVTEKWGKDRGPCVITEYPQFRENVLNNLQKTTFNKPICEVLLNQKYFNGIGNYLRAEILNRAGVRPFEESRKVLEPQVDEEEITKNKSKETQQPDILNLCHILSKEVVDLSEDVNGGGYGSGESSSFNQWLQCYYQPSMTSIRDHNGRTIWFSGEPGPLVPKEIKNVHQKKGTGKAPSKNAVEVKSRKKDIAANKVNDPDESHDQARTKPRIKAKRTKDKQAGTGETVAKRTRSSYR